MPQMVVKPESAAINQIKQMDANVKGNTPYLANRLFTGQTVLPKAQKQVISLGNGNQNEARISDKLKQSIAKNESNLKYDLKQDDDYSKRSKELNKIVAATKNTIRDNDVDYCMTLSKAHEVSLA